MLRSHSHIGPYTTLALPRSDRPTLLTTSAGPAAARAETPRSVTGSFSHRQLELVHHHLRFPFHSHCTRVSHANYYRLASHAVCALVPLSMRFRPISCWFVTSRLARFNMKFSPPAYGYADDDEDAVDDEDEDYEAHSAQGGDAGEENSSRKCCPSEWLSMCLPIAT